MTISGSTLTKNSCHAINISCSSLKDWTFVPEIGEQLSKVKIVRMKGVACPTKSWTAILASRDEYDTIIWNHSPYLDDRRFFWIWELPTLWDITFNIEGKYSQRRVLVAVMNNIANQKILFTEWLLQPQERNPKSITYSNETSNWQRDMCSSGPMMSYFCAGILSQERAGI